jgi:TetR/AcrR family transcriptional repressor of nem operon
VAKSVANFNARLESLILERLKAGRAEFSADFDPAAAARTIIALYIGLMAMAKQKPSPEQVKLIIGQIRKILS